VEWARGEYSTLSGWAALPAEGGEEEGNWEGGAVRKGRKDRREDKLTLGLLWGVGTEQPEALKGPGCYEKIQGQEGYRPSCHACRLLRIAPYRASWTEVKSWRGRAA
jgi:hypothetical protein